MWSNEWKVMSNAFRICELQTLLVVEVHEISSRRRKTCSLIRLRCIQSHAPKRPDSSVSIATELRAGRSGDRIPMRGEIFRTCPDRPWGPTSLMYSGYRVFPGGKERPRRDADPSPPSSAVVKKEYSYTSIPLWAVRPVQSLSACTTVHFIFTFL